MAYRNKTYVCFDADSDMHYYRLMQAWKQNDHTPFNFHNAHEINSINADASELTIKRKLKERIANSKCFVVLVGENTRYLYKFVRWEIEEAISANLPIIVCNLNGKRSMDSDRCPPLLRERLAIHVSFNAAIIQHALETWPETHERLRDQVAGSYYYKESVYLGLSL